MRSETYDSKKIEREKEKVPLKKNQSARASFAVFAVAAANKYVRPGMKIKQIEAFLSRLGSM